VVGTLGAARKGLRNMPTLALTNFNIIVSLLGGWISLFGLVSFLLKETFYLSEAREFSFTLCRKI
jgi:hypothetical protein